MPYVAPLSGADGASAPSLPNYVTADFQFLTFLNETPMSQIGGNVLHFNVAEILRWTTVILLLAEPAFQVQFPAMRKVNTNQMEEVSWLSPKRKFGGMGKQVSEALGRDPKSTDVMLRHPFDVEIMRIPPGKAPCPHHSHSAQWEFYHVISGRGIARHKDGQTPIEPGDAFIFKPGEPHQLLNNGTEDLVVYLVADNPIGESCYYPDSKKWIVHNPERRLMRSEPLDYYDGEE